MQVRISSTKLRVGKDNMFDIRGWELRLLLGGLLKLLMNVFSVG